MSKLSIAITLLLLTILGCQKNNDSTLPNVDLNGDGKANIFYQDDGDHYFELLDKNFDGKVDQSIRFSSEHFMLSGKFDDNFDGILETKIIATNGIVSKGLVDSNLNRHFDICFQYHGGVVQYAKRFYPASDSQGQSQVGTVRYVFGYPEGNEVLENVTLDERGFSDLADNSTGCNI